MGNQFFLFGTTAGYALWEKINGACMPARDSRQVVAKSKKISVLLNSVTNILHRINEPINMEYLPPPRAKKVGGRALNEDEIKKVKKIFLELSLK